MRGIDASQYSSGIRSTVKPEHQSDIQEFNRWAFSIVPDVESKFPASNETTQERQIALKRPSILRNRKGPRDHFTHFSPSDCPDWQWKSIEPIERLFSEPKWPTMWDTAKPPPSYSRLTYKSSDAHLFSAAPDFFILSSPLPSTLHLGGFFLHQRFGRRNRLRSRYSPNL